MSQVRYLSLYCFNKDFSNQLTPYTFNKDFPNQLTPCMYQQGFSVPTRIFQTNKPLVCLVVEMFSFQSNEFFFSLKKKTSYNSFLNPCSQQFFIYIFFQKINSILCTKDKLTESRKLGICFNRTKKTSFLFFLSEEPQPNTITVCWFCFSPKQQTVCLLVFKRFSTTFPY